MEGDYDKYTLIGLGAGSALLGFYLFIASLLGGFQFAINNFVKLWYWMIPLIVGFGIQVGMFFYMKNEMHKKAAGHAAASAGISTGAMVACCAHHIADIAPFLGIAALGLFLTKYQATFLIMGILSNILGIVYMGGLMQAKYSRQKIRLLLYSLLIISIIAVVMSYYLISKNQGNYQENTQPKNLSFQTLTNNQNNVEFKVTPISTNEFQITMDTHSVDLDFDLTQISVLYDDLGNGYNPLKWEGSEPGGHHRSGILKFLPINKGAKSINLVITDSTKREFSWNLN